MTITDNKVVLITGAARGIGLATAKVFLDDGWDVCILDNNATTLAAAEVELNLSNNVLAIHSDVSDPKQVKESVDKIVDRFGRLDALVNNAGIANFKTIGETTFEEWREIMATNLDGPFLCSQACVPVMEKSGGGSIVNITSISGLRASTLRVAYGTSKAGLMHLTKQQAVELGEKGIRANAVAPGPVNTEMAKKVHDAAIRQAYHDMIPTNRYGLEEEIANTILFLSSEKASFITGQLISVDGGFEATGIGLPDLRK
ncbi:MAG: SDR family oxidoreductase [Rhizobiaceae bacterium]